MTPEQIRIAVEAMAAGMATTVTERATRWVELEAKAQGIDIVPGSVTALALDLGITAGFVETLKLLQELGIMPGGESS